MQITEKFEKKVTQQAPVIFATMSIVLFTLEKKPRSLGLSRCSTSPSFFFFHDVSKKDVEPRFTFLHEEKE